MFQIFNGQVRGLGEQPKQDIYMRVSVDFRRYLHHFKGAKLAVFICIALHGNADGWSEPTVAQMESETGYEPPTISKAISDLSNTTIDGQRVLLVCRQREKGRYIRNRYLLFPSPSEIDLYDHTKKTIDGKTESEKQTMEKCVDGIKPYIEEPYMVNTKDSLSPAHAGETAKVSKFTRLAHFETPLAPGHKDNSAKPIVEEYQPLRQPTTPKVPAKGSPAEPVKPAIDQPLRDAVAIHIQRIQSADAGRLTGLIAQAIASVARRRLQTNRLTSDQYRVLAGNVPLFALWMLEQAEVNIILDPKKIEDWYARWLNAGKPSAGQRKTPRTTDADLREADAINQRTIERIKADRREAPQRPEVKRGSADGMAWQATLGQLQIELNRSTYDTWLRHARLVDAQPDGGSRILTVEVANHYQSDWIERHLKSAMQAKIAYHLGCPVSLQFVIEGQ